MALFYINNFTQPKTKLVTPSLDLSCATPSEVKFSYTNWAGDIDELRIFYKTSAASSWVELASYTAGQTNWTDITLNLPNPSTDYYVAFEGTSNYARGLTLDDVSVEASNLGVIFSDGFEDGFFSDPKMIGVSANNPSVGYVVESNSNIFGGLYKCTNSASDFTEINNGINYFGYHSLGSDNLGQAPRDMDIAITPNDGDDVHIAEINTWRSTNGGTSFNTTSQWTPNSASSQNIGYCHANVDIMQFVGTGAATKLFVGTDGGIFKQIIQH